MTVSEGYAMTINNSNQTAQNVIINNEQPNDEEAVPIDDPAPNELDNPKDSYKGRKDDAEIDGPQQASQETDEVYADPRKEENLPPGGKNVGDLNAYDLSQDGNKI